MGLVLERNMLTRPVRGTEPDSGFPASISVTWNSTGHVVLLLFWGQDLPLAWIDLRSFLIPGLCFLPNQIYPTLVNWVLEPKSRSPLWKVILLVLACHPSSRLFLLCCFYIKTVSNRDMSQRVDSSADLDSGDLGSGPRCSHISYMTF